MRFLARASDPALTRARRLCPLTLGGLDFSPVLAIIVISFTGAVLGQWLWGLGLGAPASSFFILEAGEILGLLQSLVWLVIILMFIRLLMSLVRPSPYNIIVQVVFSLTEPLLAPLRRAFPPGPGGLDFRPLVFLLILLLLQFVVLGSLAAGMLRGAMS
jgi:YggT family protein